MDRLRVPRGDEHRSTAPRLLEASRPTAARLGAAGAANMRVAPSQPCTDAPTPTPSRAAVVGHPARSLSQSVYAAPRYNANLVRVLRPRLLRGLPRLSPRLK
jgi:hypothetical protein